MKRLLISVVAVCAMFTLARANPAGAAGPPVVHTFHVALSSYGGSGATGTVDIHPVGTGQSQIDLEARGLAPRTQYTVFYDPGDDCIDAHHTLGVFITDTRGGGSLHAKVLGRITTIGAVAVRLGTLNDGKLVACASIGTPDVDPTVVATSPVDGAVNVPRGTLVTAKFSEAMDPPSLDYTTFFLKADDLVIPAAVEYNAVTWTATLTPTNPLTANKLYTAFVTTGATDNTGEGLEVDYVWHFMTGTNMLARISASASDAVVGVANGVSLKGNPLRSGPATIQFGLARADRVHIRIYDMAGRLVCALVNAPYTAGMHEVVWDRLDASGRVVPRGVYFARVSYEAQRFVATDRMVIVQ